MAIKKQDLERMFAHYPSEKEVKLKGNIVDVAHIVGYHNATKGIYDQGVVHMAEKLYQEELYTHDVFDAFLKADDNKLKELIRKIHYVFGLDVPAFKGEKGNKRLYTRYKESIVAIYKAQS
ncbi:hypothetical protein IMZ31_22510 (plasmid) [Pontibacillus sp. ALD_SL1]|uniref:hypothetical protein n=1 Tax=Pontibacillus sp. ALD_SL1 TaxID=2777185 RepID=UPI001A95CA70|nr:hypothetical protein [Pontibacillus sp. ALD_SL1]QST02229.1 hypothetical protein IMZ31_22510 [Pontibacillus sp. ALD_SL1]